MVEVSTSQKLINADARIAKLEAELRQATALHAVHRDDIAGVQAAYDDMRTDCEQAERERDEARAERDATQTAMRGLLCPYHDLDISEPVATCTCSDDVKTIAELRELCGRIANVLDEIDWLAWGDQDEWIAYIAELRAAAEGGQA